MTGLADAFGKHTGMAFCAGRTRQVMPRRLICLNIVMGVLIV